MPLRVRLIGGLCRCYANVATGTLRALATDLRNALMRSISCMVRAVKYDSPHAEHDHIGMPSMIRRLSPLPKLRVTCLSEGLPAPQLLQLSSAEVGSDDDELASGANLDDSFAGEAREGLALDDVLGFPARPVALTLDDLPGEDDVFEVEDSEVVIFEFVRSVSGDHLGERADQLPELCDRCLSHAQVYAMLPSKRSGDS
jgi:hypothetical protein